MKRLITIAIALTLVLALAACSSKEPKENKGAREMSEVPPNSSSQEASSAPALTDAATYNARIIPTDVHLVQFNEPDAGDTVAIVKTSVGDFKIRLFTDQAPKTTQTFIDLAKDGYYNNRVFSQVVPGFQIGGVGAPSDDKYPTERELSLDLWHFTGAVTLSNSGTNFMVINSSYCLNPIEELEAINFPVPVIEKYKEVGGAPALDFVNPVFGQVYDGMDVVEKIMSAPLGEAKSPVTPVVISEIEIASV